MARTITEIQQEIINEKSNHPELDNLDSGSATAIWRLWAYVVAVAVYMHEALWDLFKNEIDEIVAGAISGTPRWYQEQCFLYQHGDDLTYEDEQFIYNPVDLTKQIIKRASVTENLGIVFIKVAKLDSEELPTKLSADELNGFTSYINQIKFAGTRASVISLYADDVEVDLDIYYDPTVINGDGTLISDPTVYPVNEAVNDFLTAIPYDGKLYKSKLIDAIQAAEGVIDVVVTELKAKANTESVYTAITRVYSAASGYYRANNVSINYNV